MFRSFTCNSCVKAEVQGLPSQKFGGTRVPGSKMGAFGEDSCVNSPGITPLLSGSSSHPGIWSPRLNSGLSLSNTAQNKQPSAAVQGPRCAQGPDGTLDFLYLFKRHFHCDWVISSPQWVCLVSYPRVKEERGKSVASTGYLSLTNWVTSKWIQVSEAGATRGQEPSGPSL